MIAQRLLDRGHLGLARKAGGRGAHDLGSGELAELGVEHPDGVDVAAREQRLHRPAKPDPRLQVGEIFRVEPHLNDAWLIHAADAGVFKMLVIDLTPARLLNNLILLAAEQRPERIGLRLLQRRWTEGEVHVDVAEVGVALLIGDPELVEHCGVGKLA